MSELSDATIGRLAGTMALPPLPPRYRPLEVIGRGGMGVVWRARDEQLERDVAVKLLAEHVDGAALVARLRREARILAQLEHPGIVAVHDSGVLDDGRAWYAMRLVRGVRLDAAAPTLGSHGAALRVMVRLAETLAFAHEQGIVHRDLKPANVMVGPFGEVLVLDWGVARVGDGADVPGTTSPAQSPPVPSAATDHATVLGTPGYMAPEQAAGLGADARSDVYGLGAILRDLLAAQPRRIPPALAAIRHRAMAADPAQRYADALAFRDDLVRYMDGDAVSAHREGALERMGRFAARYRTPILLVVAYLVMRVVVLLWRGI